LLNLEQALEFGREDECVEVTPKHVRVRKTILDQNERARNVGRAKKVNLNAE
jgi:GTP-binding protein